MLQFICNLRGKVFSSFRPTSNAPNVKDRSCKAGEKSNRLVYWALALPVAAAVLWGWAPLPALVCLIASGGLLLIDATRLSVGSKDEDPGPVAWLAGLILLWACVFPLYFSTRRKYFGGNLLPAALAVDALVIIRYCIH